MRVPLPFLIFFFFNDTATTEIYTLSLHDALPILLARYDRLSRDRRGLFPYILERVRLVEYEHPRMRLCARESQASVSIAIALRISSSLVRRFMADTLWKSGCIGLILAPGFVLIAPERLQLGLFPRKRLRWIRVAVIGRNGWSCIAIVPTICAATPRV